MSAFTLAQPEAPKTVDVASLNPTMDTVHSMSVFELRQWLTREGEFKESEFREVNQKTLMQKAVQVLLSRSASKVQEKEDSKKAAEEKGEVETLQQRLTRQKAERKAAAIARSKARQTDSSYFKQVQVSNDEGKKALEEKKQEGQAEVEVGDEEEEAPEVETQDDDPFRPDWKKGQRNKIFTR